MSATPPRTVAHFSDSGAFGGTERALLHLLGGLDRARWRPVLFHADLPGATQLADEARALGVPTHAVAVGTPDSAGIPSERSSAVVPSERSPAVMPSERSSAVMPSQRSSDVIPSQRSSAVIPSQRSSDVIPSERSESRNLHVARGVASIVPIARALRRERAVVFHAHQIWSLSCRYGIVAAALAGVRARVATAQLFVEMPPLIGIDLQHAVLTRALHRHIAVSRFVAARLRDRFHVKAEKIVVIPNAAAIAPRAGDPVPRLELARNATSPIVLTVARLDAQKGIAHLLDAAAAVPDASFAIAGDGPDRAALEARAAALGVTDRVRFLGHRRDVPALLAAADLFVLPSLYEGLPLSVLEAMAAGVPVVATAIGGTDEVVRDGETGTLVPPADPSALAAAIRRTLADRDRALRLAANARSLVAREYSVESMVGAVSRLYDSLVER